jgi:exonuclease SbcD
MTRLAVVADVHCDDFGSKTDPATGLNARWADTVGMLRWVALDARARGCDALVVAGDLSEARHPAPWRVAQIGEALDAFDGPVVLVRGNHDGLRAGRSIADVLAAGRPGWSGFSSPGIAVVGDTAVACLPYLDKHHMRALPGYESVPEAEVFAVLADAYITIARGLYAEARATSARSAVLVVHQALAGGSMSEAQQVFLGDHALVADTRALAAIGFEAVLAGHFHKHQVLSESPLVAYAGSPYRTDFGEEHQAKGYMVVDVAPGSAAMEFVESPARRFYTIDLAKVFADHAVGAAEGAVVRVVNAPADMDAAALRRRLEDAGAFDVVEIRRAPVAAAAAAGSMAEGLAPAAALAEYFAADPDAAVLVERGRELLAEAVAA